MKRSIQKNSNNSDLECRYWLVKTEPDVYSIEMLIKDKKTHWNGVRNYQARNYMRQMKLGDQVLIYHSQTDRAVVGKAEIVRQSYPDLDIKADEPKGDWLMVDLGHPEKFQNTVSLATIKADPILTKTLLVKQSRLSVMPLSKEQYQRFLDLSQKTNEHSPGKSQVSIKRKGI